MREHKDNNSETAVEPPIIEWGVAAQSFDGGADSGDQYLVEVFANGALVVVVDGLGHGPKAAVAGKTAVSILKAYADHPVASLLRRCHEGVRRTRGVVMSLASFDGCSGTMTWLGVGNVKGLLLRKNGGPRHGRERLVLRGGVVGYNLPTPRPSVVSVEPGDTLIFATDGLRSVFAEDLTCGDAPQEMADRILTQYRRGTDDAMVLVARYVGINEAEPTARVGGRDG
ncbi:MAG TPA: stage II sporulation protein E (SpoIIE) [Chloroflexi bacterium]|nr:stage II sporulation protein E (SpoIIE) [Chloroflexota bacterium]